MRMRSMQLYQQRRIGSHYDFSVLLVQSLRRAKDPSTKSVLKLPPFQTFFFSSLAGTQNTPEPANARPQALQGTTDFYCYDCDDYCNYCYCYCCYYYHYHYHYYYYYYYYYHYLLPTTYYLLPTTY